jgi:hypothetical protein
MHFSLPREEVFLGLPRALQWLTLTETRGGQDFVAFGSARDLTNSAAVLPVSSLDQTKPNHNKTSLGYIFGSETNLKIKRGR